VTKQNDDDLGAIADELPALSEEDGKKEISRHRLD